MDTHKKPIIFLATLLLTLSFVATAEDSSDAVGSGPNPYRDCGVGAALFPESHVWATLSNLTWDLGSTAITSATMSPETCSNSNVKTAKFIIDNYDNLIEEAAKGEGEHLAAVLDIQGCSTASHNEVIAEIRQAMHAQVASESYPGKHQVKKASDYYNVVTSASSNCSV